MFFDNDGFFSDQKGLTDIASLANGLLDGGCGMCSGGGDIKMTKKDFVKEHKKLISLLNTSSKKLGAEASEQSKELKKMTGKGDSDDEDYPVLTEEERKAAGLPGFFQSRYEDAISKPPQRFQVRRAPKKLADVVVRVKPIDDAPVEVKTKPKSQSKIRDILPKAVQTKRQPQSKVRDVLPQIGKGRKKKIGEPLNDNDMMSLLTGYYSGKKMRGGCPKTGAKDCMCGGALYRSDIDALVNRLNNPNVSWNDIESSLQRLLVEFPDAGIIRQRIIEYLNQLPQLRANRLAMPTVLANTLMGWFNTLPVVGVARPLMTPPMVPEARVEGEPPMTPMRLASPSRMGAVSPALSVHTAPPGTPPSQRSRRVRITPPPPPPRRRRREDDEEGGPPRRQRRFAPLNLEGMGKKKMTGAGYYKDKLNEHKRNFVEALNRLPVPDDVKAGIINIADNIVYNGQLELTEIGPSTRLFGVNTQLAQDKQMVVDGVARELATIYREVQQTVAPERRPLPQSQSTMVALQGPGNTLSLGVPYTPQNEIVDLSSYGYTYPAMPPSSTSGQGRSKKKSLKNK